MSYFLVYLAIINIYAFIHIGADKRKAVLHKYRLPHKTIITTALLGGGLGILVGMCLFRHKTKNYKLIFQVIAIVVFWMAGIMVRTQIGGF